MKRAQARAILALVCSAAALVTTHADGCNGLKFISPGTNSFSSSSSNGVGRMSMSGVLQLQNTLPPGAGPIQLKTVAIEMMLAGHSKATVIPVTCPAGEQGANILSCNYHIDIPEAASGEEINTPMAVLLPVAFHVDGSKCHGAKVKLMSPAWQSAQIQASTQQYVDNVYSDVNSYLNSLGIPSVLG